MTEIKFEPPRVHFFAIEDRERLLDVIYLLVVKAKGD
jgi:hypothetical protein